jgi:hypothetical protein
MNRTVKHLGCLLALLLLAGCLPKRALYFFPASRPVSHPPPPPPSPAAARAPDAAIVPAAPVQPGNLLFTAATNPGGVAPPKPNEVLSVARTGNVQPQPGKAAFFAKQQANPGRLQKAVAKQLSKSARGKRPIHGFAWLSALGTVAGLVLFVVGTTGLAFSFGVYTGTALPIVLLALALLSFVTAAILGISGILRINKIPGRFSGAGLARVSAAASLFMVGVYLYNLLLLLLFFLV